MSAKRRKAAPAKPVRPEPGQGRAQILQCAISEFAELGFAGASTASIARRAGVTQPLVHHHFGSKRALWDEVLETLFKDLLVRLTEVTEAQAEAPRLTQLMELVRAFVRFCGQRPELAKLVRTEGTVGGEQYDALFEKHLGPLVRFVEDQLATATAEGVLRKIDARLFYFVLVGAATQPFAEPKTAERAFGLDVTDPHLIDRHAELVIDLLLRGAQTFSSR